MTMIVTAFTRQSSVSQFLFKAVLEQKIRLHFKVSRENFTPRNETKINEKT